jgi:hypothetical protein
MIDLNEDDREIEDCHDNQDDDVIENDEYNNEPEDEPNVFGKNALSLFFRSSIFTRYRP